MAAKFEPGVMVATAGALQTILRVGKAPDEYITRHVAGDWGDLTDADKEENERALEQGTRLLSAYHLPDGTKIWIITEADRSSTTVLLPEEY